MVLDVIDTNPIEPLNVRRPCYLVDLSAETPASSKEITMTRNFPLPDDVNGIPWVNEETYIDDPYEIGTVRDTGEFMKNRNTLILILRFFQSLLTTPLVFDNLHSSLLHCTFKNSFLLDTIHTTSTSILSRLLQLTCLIQQQTPLASGKRLGIRLVIGMILSCTQPMVPQQRFVGKQISFQDTWFCTATFFSTRIRV